MMSLQFLKSSLGMFGSSLRTTNPEATAAGVRTGWTVPGSWGAGIWKFSRSLSVNWTPAWGVPGACAAAVVATPARASTHPMRTNREGSLSMTVSFVTGLEARRGDLGEQTDSRTTWYSIEGAGHHLLRRARPVDRFETGPELRGTAEAAGASCQARPAGFQSRGSPSMSDPEGEIRLRPRAEHNDIRSTAARRCGTKG